MRDFQTEVLPIALEEMRKLILVIMAEEDFSVIGFEGEDIAASLRFRNRRTEALLDEVDESEYMVDFELSVHETTQIVSVLAATLEELVFPTSDTAKSEALDEVDFEIYDVLSDTDSFLASDDEDEDDFDDDLTDDD